MHRCELLPPGSWIRVGDAILSGLFFEWVPLFLVRFVGSGSGACGVAFLLLRLCVLVVSVVVDCVILWVSVCGARCLVVSVRVALAIGCCVCRGSGCAIVALASVSVFGFFLVVLSGWGYAEVFGCVCSCCVLSGLRCGSWARRVYMYAWLWAVCLVVCGVPGSVFSIVRCCWWGAWCGPHGYPVWLGFNSTASVGTSYGPLVCSLVVVASVWCGVCLLVRGTLVLCVEACCGLGAWWRTRVGVLRVAP